MPELSSHIPEKFFYNMNNKNRGIAIIFCHEFFELPSDYFERRFGTHHDCKNLERTWTKLGFKVKILHNLRYDQIIQVLKNGNYVFLFIKNLKNYTQYILIHSYS